MDIDMEMNKKILVVGGYGDVGSRICLILAKYYPGSVVAAGRSLGEAEKFSIRTLGKVLPRQLDVSKDWANHELNDVGMVIMSLDLLSPEFAKHCLKSGIHYIDITASQVLINNLEGLKGETKENNATGIISVGLDPGISNLLVKQCSREMDYPEKAEINLLFGLGEDHGDGSIEWILNNLQNDFELNLCGSTIPVQSFQDGKSVIFPRELGKRTAYAFNFSDQHVLKKTLGIPEVRTRMCFESKVITWLVAALAQIRFFKLLKYSIIKSSFKFLLKNLKLGSDVYSIKVTVRGVKAGKEVLSHGAIQGNGEAQITAEVATLVARRLLELKPNPGVYHIEELFDAKDILKHIKGARLFDKSNDVQTENTKQQLLIHLNEN